MVIINLLPWREWKRAYEIHTFKKIMVRILLSHAVILLAGYLLIIEINRECHTRLIHLNAQIKRENLWQNQTKIIQQVNAKNRQNINNKLNPMYFPNRLSLAKVFHILQYNRPHALCFVAIKRNKNNWILEGRTRTIIDLMLYLKAWQDAALFSSLNVSDLNQTANGFQFRLFALENQ